MNSKAPPVLTEELDLAELLGHLWRGKYVIFLVSVVAVSIAIVYALNAREIFRAETVVVEVRDDASAGLAASLSGQLGGLANLAGINIPNAGGRAPRPFAVLRSRQLTEEFVSTNGISELLFPELSGAERLWFTVDRFRRDILSVSEDQRSGLITVAIHWTDPGVASQWSNAYVSLANDVIRKRALDDATRNIEFLNRQISQTNVLEVQRVIYNLIENEMNSLMLANVRSEFAFAVVDPAVTPEERIKPQRTLIVFLGGALGFICGVFFVIVRAIFRTDSSSADERL